MPEDADFDFEADDDMICPRCGGCMCCGACYC